MVLFRAIISQQFFQIYCRYISHLNLCEIRSSFIHCVVIFFSLMCEGLGVRPFPLLLCAIRMGMRPSHNSFLFKLYESLLGKNKTYQGFLNPQPLKAAIVKPSTVPRTLIISRLLLPFHHIKAIISFYMRTKHNTNNYIC